MHKILRVQEDGIVTGGPPCGPWTFINMGTSGRSQENINGDQSKAYVRDSNKLLSSHDSTFCMGILYWRRFSPVGDDFGEVVQNMERRLE